MPLPNPLQTGLAAALSAAAPHQPVVATDADGTLWAGDVGDALFHRVVCEGLVSAAALARLRERAAELPSSFGVDPDFGAPALARAFVAAARAGGCSTQVLCDLEAEALGGVSLEAHARLLEDEARRHSARVHPAVRELLQEARRAGLRIHVVTGSLGSLVEATMRLGGLPYDRVDGAELREDNGVMLARLSRPASVYEGKVAALEASGHWPPALGLGDGLWDQSFLRGAFAVVLIDPQPGLAAALAGHRRLGTFEAPTSPAL